MSSSLPSSPPMPSPPPHLDGTQTTIHQIKPRRALNHRIFSRSVLYKMSLSLHWSLAWGIIVENVHIDLSCLKKKVVWWILSRFELSLTTVICGWEQASRLSADRLWYSYIFYIFVVSYPADFIHFSEPSKMVELYIHTYRREQTRQSQTKDNFH